MGLFTSVILILVYVFLLLYYRTHIKNFMLKLSAPERQPEIEQVILSATHVSQQYLALQYALRKGEQEGAAPELLEALELLMKYSARPSCESLHHDKKYRHTALEPCPVEANLYQVRIMAEDAIAKAKGETK